MEFIENALNEGRNTLSERESKDLLKSYGIPTTMEIEVTIPRAWQRPFRKSASPS